MCQDCSNSFHVFTLLSYVWAELDTSSIRVVLILTLTIITYKSRLNGSNRTSVSQEILVKILAWHYMLSGTAGI